MKKLPVIALLAASLFVFSSCDLFRKMAGRPTSKDIEAKRLLIEKEELAHQNRMDSLKTMQEYIADSLAVLDSIRLSEGALVEARQLSEETKAALRYRYYIIVGAFGKPENAGNHAEAARKAGYEASLISYKNGYTAVGICPSDKITDAYDSLRKVRESGFCPDAWILDNI